MGQIILHKDGAYQLYSTIADGPIYVSALTLKQLTEHIRQSHGEVGLRDLPSRLERAHKSGSSSAVSENLAEVIACNRAGENETELSLDEFVARYLTLAPEAA